MKKLFLFLIGCGAMVTASAADKTMPDPMKAVEAVQINLNVVWTLIAGILVFAMQGGFALVESGLTRA